MSSGNISQVITRIATPRSGRINDSYNQKGRKESRTKRVQELAPVVEAIAAEALAIVSAQEGELWRYDVDKTLKQDTRMQLAQLVINAELIDPKKVRNERSRRDLPMMVARLITDEGLLEAVPYETPAYQSSRAKKFFRVEMKVSADGERFLKGTSLRDIKADRTARRRAKARAAHPAGKRILKSVGKDVAA